MKTLEKIYNYCAENWDVLGPIALGIIELILRAMPTKKNYSILDFMYRIIKRSIPNNRVPSGSEVITSIDKEGVRKNSVNVRVDRHIVMIFIFMLLSFAVLAQNPVTTQSRGLFLYNGSDTTALKNIRQNLQNATGNTGGLIFDRHNNKWRVWNGSAWVDWNIFNGGGITGQFWPLSGNGKLTSVVSIYPDATLGNSIDLFIGGNQSQDSVVRNLSLTAEASLNATSLGAANLLAVSDFDIASNTGALNLNANAGDINLAAANDIISLSKHYFSPTGTLSGLNIGSVAGDPTSRENADLWYDTSTGGMSGQIGGSIQNVVTNLKGENPIGRAAYWADNVGRLTSESVYAYNGATNTLSVPQLALSSLSSTRIPIAGTAGLLGDNASFIFIENGNNDEVRNIATQGAFRAGPVTGGPSGVIGVSTIQFNDDVGDNNGSIFADGNLTLSHGIGYDLIADIPIVVPANPDAFWNNRGIVSQGTSFLHATANLNFPSTASGQQSGLSISVPGAAAGDAVAWGCAACVVGGGGANGFFAEAATDAVNIFYFNASGGPLDPPATSYSVRVFK